MDEEVLSPSCVIKMVSDHEILIMHHMISLGM